MSRICGLATVLFVAGLFVGCGGGTGMESLPEDQRKPDAGLAASEKLKQSIPLPGAKKAKSKTR